MQDGPKDETGMVRDGKAESTRSVGVAVLVMVEDKRRDIKRKAKEQNPEDRLPRRALFSRISSGSCHLVLA